MRLSIVIVSYNTRQLLADCLQSLYDDPDHDQWQIIVVDNASSDDSVTMVARQFPQATLVTLDSNIGFARANNRGARIATGRHLLFLNADTVAPAGVITALCDFLDQRADAAIVGPRLVYPDGRLQYSARTFPGPLNTFLEYSFVDRLLPNVRLFGRPRLTYMDHKQVQPVDYVAGACLMICREYFDNVGGWCEGYFFYAEDADLCAKVKRVGGKTYYYGRSRIIHIGGASADQVALPATLEAHRSVFLFVRRNGGLLAFWATRLITVVALLIRSFFGALAWPVAALLGKGEWLTAQLHKYGRVLALCLSRNILPSGRFLE